MMPFAMVWDNLTRISGVTTWLLQCLDAMPRLGLDPWIFDLGREQGGEMDCSRWARRIVHLPRARRQSEEGWRRAVRRAFQDRDLRAAVFHEHRFGEDVMWSLPDGFPAANVLHADRPDAGYYHLARELDPLLRENWCVSASITRKFSAGLSPDRAARTHYLPLGIPLPPPPALTPPPPGEPISLLYLGRIVKGQKRILDAAPFCAEMDRLGIPFVFHLVGDGVDMAELRDALAPWLRTGRAVVHGAVSYEEAMRIAAATHVFLLFSTFEGLPLSLLEAMARGNLPVVTRIESGVADILTENVDALFFPVEQPAEAARKIAALRGDPVRLQALREAAAGTARRFDQTACMAAYAERIRALCLKDNETDSAWRRPRPAAYTARPWRQRLLERRPGWLGGGDA